MYLSDLLKHVKTPSRGSMLAPYYVQEVQAFFHASPERER